MPYITSVEQNEMEFTHCISSCLDINELSALAPTNELPIPETFLSEDLQIILAYSLTFGFVSSLIIGIGFLTCFPQSLKLRDRPYQEDTSIET
ncbi:MAG: hypothetical protein VKJ24_07445 [Synechococcales bacterium]|nr:hypothetical protein [Synechococcales bacterium]